MGADDEVDCGEGDDTLIYRRHKDEVPRHVNCETVMLGGPFG